MVYCVTYTSEEARLLDDTGLTTAKFELEIAELDTGTTVVDTGTLVLMTVVLLAGQSITEDPQEVTVISVVM